jgi:hypothetical protein
MRRMTAKHLTMRNNIKDLILRCEHSRASKDDRLLGED